MIEEKKRSVKKQTIESKRNSILDNYQKRALLENSKNALHNEAQRKVADKNLKRIGSKNQIKAYLEIVNEIGNKENEIKKNEIESNIKIYPQVKHLKRIGKQKMLGAYVQSVTEVSRMSIKERSLEPIITINKKVYEKSKENEKNPREDKENISSNNLSEIWHQSQMATEMVTDQLQLGVISSEKQCADNEYFQINIKKVDSEDDNESSVEPFTPTKKCDECVQSSIKTDSYQGASDSDIVDGDLSKLISSYEEPLNKENFSDLRIDEILQEIQKNQIKNFQSSSRQNNQQSKNYLMVPEKASQTKSAKTTKVNIKKQENKQQSQEKEYLDQPHGQQIPSIEKTNSEQYLHQDGSKKHQKIEDKNLRNKKQKNKKSFQSWLQGKKHKLNKPTKKDFKIENSSLQNLSLNESVSVKKSPPQPQKKRLLLSQGPKKAASEQLTDGKISKSLVKALPQIVEVQMTQSQVKLSKIKARQISNEYSKSLHEKKSEKFLHKESIAMRFKSKVPKLQEINTKTEQVKIVTPIKRSHRQLEVNRCVGQARRILSNNRQNRIE